MGPAESAELAQCQIALVQWGSQVDGEALYLPVKEAGLSFIIAIEFV